MGLDRLASRDDGLIDGQVLRLGCHRLGWRGPHRCLVFGAVPGGTGLGEERLRTVRGPRRERKAHADRYGELTALPHERVRHCRAQALEEGA